MQTLSRASLRSSGGLGGRPPAGEPDEDSFSVEDPSPAEGSSSADDFPLSEKPFPGKPSFPVPLSSSSEVFLSGKPPWSGRSSAVKLWSDEPSDEFSTGRSPEASSPVFLSEKPLSETSPSDESSFSCSVFLPVEPSPGELEPSSFSSSKRLGCMSLLISLREAFLR